MKKLFITEDPKVFEICVRYDLLCAIKTNLSVTMDDIQEQIPILPICDMKTKEIEEMRFEHGILQLLKGRNVYAKDILTPEWLLTKVNTIVPDLCKYDGPNDLQSKLPQVLKADSCMTYIGANNSGTPFHRDQGGSPGHNCMVFAEPNAYATWYFIHKNHASVVERQMKKFNYENTMRTLTEIEAVQDEIKKTSIKINELQIEKLLLQENQAFITKYRRYQESTVLQFDQHQGYMVFIPNGTMHQVHNYGLSIKVAWNITTPLACEYFFDVLRPIYSDHRRSQVYRHSACLLFYIYSFYTSYMDNGLDKMATMLNNYHMDQLRLSLSVFEKELFQLYLPQQVIQEYNNNLFNVDGYNLVCDHCRGDIFMYSFHCNCRNNHILDSLHQKVAVKSSDGYDYCVRCFSMMSDSDRHCNSIEIRALLPDKLVFDKLIDICAMFNDLAKYKQYKCIPLSCTHEILKDFPDASPSRDGYRALKKYQLLIKKRKRSMTMTSSQLKRRKSEEDLKQETIDNVKKMYPNEDLKVIVDSSDSSFTSEAQQIQVYHTTIHENPE